MLRAIVLPGAVLAVLSFLVGFLLNDVARQGAYNKAYEQASSKIVDIAATASEAAASAKQSSLEGQRLIELANKVVTESEDIQNKLKRALELQEVFSKSENLTAEVKSALRDDKAFIAEVSKFTSTKLSKVERDVESLTASRVESGVISVSESRDYIVNFSPPYSKPPVVVFGAVYSVHNKGEAFATMIRSPTEKDFSVRLVHTGAGNSSPGEWARGKINWVAIGTR